MENKVKTVLQTIVDKFKSGEIPEAVAMASFPVLEIPSSAWSFTNRTIMFLSGTGDARGFRQWKAANRWVKKGARAIYILVPCFKKQTDDQTGEENDVLCFFKPSAVFAVEQTDGQPLEYPDVKVPDLPLLDKAAQWGIPVKAIPGDYRYMGYYSLNRREIVLASPEEKIFFHELAHAGHDKIKRGLEPGQNPLQEIVAELCAQALCRLVGKEIRDTTGNSYRYIEGYAKKLKMSPASACLRVLAESEKVLNLILTPESNETG